MAKGLVSGHLDVNVLLAFIFGIIFISVMLFFAVKFQNPSRFSQWVFIIVTSLAGAGIGAVIPGILKVDLPYAKAGGALAIFVMVLLNKPALVESVAKFVPPPEPGLPIALDYVSKVDAHMLDMAWESLDSESKATVARDRVVYNQAYENGRYALGQVSRRIPMGTSEVTSPSGYPLGIYRIIAFRTSFLSGRCHQEKVALRGAEDMRWRVFEHSIDPSPIPYV